MDYFDCLNGVDREILRGIQLRDTKNKLCRITKQYDVVNIALNEPSCSKSSPWQNLTSCRKTNLFRKYGHSRNIANIRENANVTKKRKITSRNKSFRRPKTKCPLRVAELSVPTKRHCLETWRNNKDVLPSFMVERLRQIIMDEKPIVKIYEAFDCFKRQKTSKFRSPLSGRKNVKSKRHEQIRLFCALLSYKIIQKLLPPLNLTLNPELTTLSSVVDDEITNILKNLNKSKLNAHKIQTEIADMITVWIASILEESGYKLLLEEFQELQDEEGPVWDLIDEIIDYVVVTCEPESIVSSSVTEPSVSSNNINEELSVKVDEASENKYDKISLKSSNIVQIHKDDSIIVQILNNIFYNENALTSNNSVTEKGYDRVLDSNSNLNINSKFKGNSNVSLKESKDYLNRIPAASVQNTSLIEMDSHINNVQINDNNNTHLDDEGDEKQANLNVTDVEGKTLNIEETNIEIEHNIDINSVSQNMESTGNKIEVQNEDTPDDSIKKVKFSNSNIGVNTIKTSISNDRIILNREHDDIPIKLSKDGNIKSDLKFAPPNEHLLSDADESWPENLQFPVLKATISVSKSVLSLGKILESEEKQLKPVSKDTDLKDDSGSLTRSFPVDINDEIEKDKNLQRYETKKNTGNNMLDHQNNETSFMPSSNDITKNEKLPKETSKITKNNTNMVLEHMAVNDIKSKEYFSNRKNVREEAIQTEQIRKNSYGQIHPTEDLLTQLKLYTDPKNICSYTNYVEGYNRKKIEVYKWCKGLENVIQNLELWTDWVENTCNWIMLLKQKGDKKHLSGKFREKNNMWIILKYNVDSDSKIWQKVSKRLKSGITTYRKYYIKSKRDNISSTV